MIWFAIAFSFLRLHPRLEATGQLTDVRMWAPSVLPWATIALAGGIVVLMLTDEGGRFQVIAVAVVVTVITVAGLIWTNTGAFKRRR